MARVWKIITWIREHSPDMRADRQNGQSLENDPIDNSKDPVWMRVENNAQHHKPANKVI
jgi:hypothetical protein